jgi:anti-sigma B factor antagonist
VEGITVVGQLGPATRPDFQRVLTNSRLEVPMPQVSSLTTVVPPRWTPPAFRCTLQTGVSGAAWVVVAGELDLATSPQLDRMLTDAVFDARLAVLDLRAVTFIDTAGVHVLLDAARAARSNGCRLMLVRGPAQVDGLLTLTGAAQHLSIFDLDPSETAEMLHLAPMHPNRMHAVE